MKKYDKIYTFAINLLEKGLGVTKPFRGFVIWNYSKVEIVVSWNIVSWNYSKIVIWNYSSQKPFRGTKKVGNP